MHIVLVEPEIPPNTGNIARLCAATKTPLHLIKPLGFSLEDRYLKRAGLDYWKHVELKIWNSWQEYRENMPNRLVLSSARRGQALHEFKFEADDALVFGCETQGLPEYVLECSEHRVRIPIWGEVRSLNLANSAGIILYQGLHSAGLLP
ncbi:tRNA (cytidine(34)-2'-O)-methyltransferase [Desulfovibrio litoralis]|uniref:Putative tRNA (cytidine(34)-2'-O)-methyltransferase n=1 Tax=Desulfovibrio litoralis DSM 11393 TaxID=1121455 RepID=A0A1M7RXD8_9BACT|nr:tRNA (cytidine(34)-2'-O)-methyltransferase [Desulfovibrio litoralis]SHN50969.1 tRNA (cytidine/uridine-2'-O-)-methyltransferase [Desulfovibrio litoralis DSM 11393]